MFRTTTHYKYWIFDDEDELYRRRQEANHRFIRDNITLINVKPDEVPKHFLTMAEEVALVNYYLSLLRDFCRRFNPPIPKYVTSTSIQYFKRFYLNNSVMEHHPKHLIVTCVYLAAKIEEFNVTMDQFVKNVKGDREKAAEIVLNNELLLLHKINYQLIIWHPYRSIEGFLIDIKTRCKSSSSNQDPERYRQHIDTFIDQCFLTDAFFLLCPNQLALLAIIYAADKFGESMDEYLQILFGDNSSNEIAFLHKWMISML
ncbi:hypothetical protein DERP_012749 [Dermatophagoides pteronyssinus]|uniref:Cyclin-H n=1 Tax=Dermatophagoides pteronyssinus TaxID=6956 RepID=A0ABQ8JQX8_DERPT|nr:hypothetical protein DERP_012749 [Dermatophagoides pteronyssinus]